MPVDRAGEIGVRAPGVPVGVEAGVGDVDFMAGAFPWVRLIGEEGVVGLGLGGGAFDDDGGVAGDGMGGMGDGEGEL